MKNCSSALLIAVLFLCSVLQVYAQAVLSGTVTDMENMPLSGITILLEGTDKGVATNGEGYFLLKGIRPNTYTMEISGIGFKKQRLELVLSEGEQRFLTITLAEQLTQIDGVVLTGKGNAARIEEGGFAVNSIETKTFKNVTADVSQILNQTSGVRIKETGGMGSQYEFSLNGLSGRQIRIFVDDIPVDQLGSSFNLNNLPVNLVDRIDVYKGVIPINLGADALGGAVNIITDKKANSFMDLSHSMGSFNTHRTAINGKHRFERSGLTIKASGFYNSSNNDYQMNDMPVFVNGTEQLRDITRFHDGYNAVMGNMGVGFTNVVWADALMVEVAKAHIEQDIQSGIYGTPVGEATEEEDNTTYSLRYVKSGLLNGKLGIALFGLYNEVMGKSVDTSSNRYDWSGNIIRAENNNLGELVREKSIFQYDQSQFLYRVHADYALTTTQTLSINHIHSDIERTGGNELNTNGNEPFRYPNTLRKTVTGLAYESNIWENRFQNILSLKYFDFDMLSKNAVQFQQNQFRIEDISTSQQNLGYALASRFFITDDWYVKASYEKGYRIPQPIEIFGDGLRILANPFLAPESSHNINLGLGYAMELGRATLKNDVNLFQRDVKNFIYIQQSGVFSSYENVLNVLVRGVEWDFLYARDKFAFNGNLTWQNVMNNQEFVEGTITKSRVYRDRMPNTPYFFANANVNMDLGAVFSRVGMSMYYGVNYVHRFFLNYPSVSVSSTKNRIPTQFLNHWGTTFSTPDNAYNISVELRNIFNAEAYDNFNLQKPGRAIYLKLRYFLDN